MFNFVRTTVYYTLVVCYHSQSKREKGNKKRREVAIYMSGMCRTSLLNLKCLPMSGNGGQCVHVPFILSTYLLSRSECTSLQHRRGGKENKQVKHEYLTSSQSDEGIHHHNTSKCSTQYVPLFIRH